MVTPNWQHHSKKEQKRSLKPQALRQSRERLRFLINKLNANHSQQLNTNASQIHSHINRTSR